MNNLEQNYKKMLKELEVNFNTIEDFTQIRKPKMSNLELIALDMTAEYMAIDSELQLFRAIRGTELDGKIERSVYNKRRIKLTPYKRQIQKEIIQKFTNLSNLFIVDSTPIPICKLSRAKRSMICSTADISPAFGYCPAQKMRYFGYKLHLICDENAIIKSYDISPANIHDVNYLKDVKYELSNCELIGDRGYISADYQLDLFNERSIKLSVPMRSNALNSQEFSKIKRKKRKRIETLFSQLYGQFNLGRNYAKSLDGLMTRMVSKITALTMIQYLNLFVFHRKINAIKVNIS
jgi:hypothetical protein